MVATEKLGIYLCQRLHDAGCADLFGVPGDFNLGLLNYVIDSKINYVGCCNELNAAYASDGYARIKGIAACVTTYAVGELSAINGVAGSFAESVPVVKITGSPARKFFREMPLLHHTLGDYMTPYKMYEKITIDQVMLDDPRTAARDIDRVIHSALLYKKPVYISVPADMVEEQIDLTEGEFKLPSEPHTDEDVLAEAIDEIVSMIGSAKRPVFIPGVELIRRNMQGVFEELTNKTNIPYVTMMLSKGLLDEGHPHFVGLYAGARSRQEVKDCVSNSDCVIIIGEKMTDFNTGGFSTGIDSKKRIVINYSSVTVSSHSYNNVYLGTVLKNLIAKLAPFPEPAYDYPRASTGCIHRKNSVLEANPNNELTMRDVFRRCASFIPENAIVIAETGASMFSAAETMMPAGATYIGQTFYGSIGFTVGACLGACMAAKSTDPSRRVILFVGDGSFQLTCQEISTMIRYKCAPVVFLINNDGYTIERVITDNVYNDIQPWKYSQLPPVFGATRPGTVCKTLGDLDGALNKAAVDEKELSFIEVVLDRWDCNDLLKNAGYMMAKNNSLKPSMPDPNAKKAV